MVSVSIVSRAATAWLVGVPLLVACGSARSAETTVAHRTPRVEAGVVAPLDGFEERLLAEIERSQPVPVAIEVDGQAVKLGEVYEAASQRHCRQVTYGNAASGHETGRLACNDGEGWFFVPAVFGASRLLAGVEAQEAAP